MPRSPVVVESFPDGMNLEADIGTDVTLICQVDALPVAEAIWIDTKVCVLSIIMKTTRKRNITYPYVIKHRDRRFEIGLNSTIRGQD